MSADLLDQIAGTAPEVAGGYADVRAVIESDGAISAARKALLVAAAAAARGQAGLVRSELERGRALGLEDADIGVAVVALLLARGEVTSGLLAEAAGGLRPAETPRPPSGLEAEAYFLDAMQVDALPTRMALMREHAPAVFAGYHRMHHGVLHADEAAGRFGELVLVAVNAGDLASSFVAIHAATARNAGVSDAELVESVVCAIPVVGVAAWASAAEGLFPAA